MSARLNTFEEIDTFENHVQRDIISSLVSDVTSIVSKVLGTSSTTTAVSTTGTSAVSSTATQTPTPTSTTPTSTATSSPTPTSQTSSITSTTTTPSTTSAITTSHSSLSHTTITSSKRPSSSSSFSTTTNPTTLHTAIRNPTTSTKTHTPTSTHVPLGSEPIKESAAIGIAFGLLALAVLVGLGVIFLKRRKKSGGWPFKGKNNHPYPQVAWLYDPAPSPRRGSSEGLVAGAANPALASNDERRASSATEMTQPPMPAAPGLMPLRPVSPLVTPRLSSGGSLNAVMAGPSYRDSSPAGGLRESVHPGRIQEEEEERAPLTGAYQGGER